MRPTVLKVALAAGAAFNVLAMASHTQAQTASTAAPDVEAVVVTGSRVITNGNNAPTPVTVVSPESLAVTKPATVFESLADLPMFSGSRGATGQPTNAQPGASTSVSALNLRNLGALRGLALFDGHRVPPTTADGYVDVNLLPAMLLSRVDVVTGGASAVYGSDAVTGVINFVVDRNFNGIKVNAQTGVSTYGDAKSWEFGIAGGQKLGERGHIEASFTHRSDDGIPHKVDRDWTATRPTLQGNGTAANPFHLQENVNIAFATFGGLIVCPGSGFTTAACPTRPLVGQTFDENGVLSPFERGSTVGLADATIQIGGDGAYHTWPSLKSKVRLDQFFTRFDYDLTDDIHAFASFSGARNYVEGNPTNLRFFGQGVNIGACNAFLATTYQSQFGCTPANSGNTVTNQPTFVFNKIFNFLTNPNAPGAIMSTTARNSYVLTGLEGKFGENYRWEIAYTHSDNKLYTDIKKNQNLQKTYAALDAVRSPSGEIVCNVTLTNPGAYPGCVPLNVFGPSAESAAALDYIFEPVTHTTRNDLNSVAGSIAGSSFNSWAGPIDIALSGELRRQTYSLKSTSPPSLVQNCLGLRFGNCNPNVTAVNINVIAPRTAVEQIAKEVAIEANIPLLKDVALAKDVNLNTAARFTRYDNDAHDVLFPAKSIEAKTWKVGLTWALNDMITVRVARSRDIRAPNLYDLYTPVAVNPNSFTTDYLVTGNPNVNVPIQSGGNPDLKPEVAHTTTLGLVLRPFEGMSLAIDAYDIKITDALASINGGAQAVQLACYSSGGTSPLCQLQERPSGYSNTAATNRLTKVYSRQVNIAEQSTKGIDFEANYKTTLAGRNLSLRGLVTYQPELIYFQPPLNKNDQAGVAYNNAYGLLPAPVYKVAAYLHYEPFTNFAVDVSQRWRSKLKWNADPTQFATGGVKAVGYTNLNLSYGFDTDVGKAVAFFNVQNLFNTDPPPSGTPGAQNQPGLPTNGYIIGDDVVGRYYTVGLRLRL